MNKSLTKLISNIDVISHDIIQDINVTGVSMNSNFIKPGNVFVAINGFNAVSYTHLTLPTICSV